MAVPLKTYKEIHDRTCQILHSAGGENIKISEICSMVSQIQNNAYKFGRKAVQYEMQVVLGIDKPE